MTRLRLRAITRTDGDLTLNAGTNAITQSGAIAVDDGAVSLTGTGDHPGIGKCTGSSDGGEWSGRHLPDGERRDCDCGDYPNGRRPYFKCGTNAITQSGAIAVDDGAVSLTGQRSPWTRQMYWEQ